MGGEGRKKKNARSCEIRIRTLRRLDAGSQTLHISHGQDGIPCISSKLSSDSANCPTLPTVETTGSVVPKSRFFGQFQKHTIKRSKKSKKGGGLRDPRPPQMGPVDVGRMVRYVFVSFSSKIYPGKRGEPSQKKRGHFLSISAWAGGSESKYPRGK